jgi:hypothetical protein
VWFWKGEKLRREIQESERKLVPRGVPKGLDISSTISIEMEGEPLLMLRTYM